MLRPKDVGSNFTKCYWLEKTPVDSKKIVYYSDQTWTVKSNKTHNKTTNGL
jgi:hypothetical protein